MTASNATAPHATVVEQPIARTAVIHYHRADGDYGDSTSPNAADFWGLHVWTGAATPTPSWHEPLRPTSVDEFGIVFVVPLTAGATELAYLIHRGDKKDPGPDQFLRIVEGQNEVWQIADDDTDQYFVQPKLPGQVSAGNLRRQRAHWISRDFIVWDVEYAPEMSILLYHAPHGGLGIKAGKVTGGKAIPLHHAAAGVGNTLLERFPHLRHYTAFRLDLALHAEIPTLLRGQLVVALVLDDLVINATALQIPGVLDDLFAHDGDLGVAVEPAGVTLRVWAPTAQAVALHLFDAESGPAREVIAMQPGPGGTWTASGGCAWLGTYYLYEVTVFVPTTCRVERNLVTDPYSVGLAMNSTRSLIVDLADPALYPPGWLEQGKPPLAAHTDITLYELHLRDFSSNDATVPAALRGKYGAFTVMTSDGMQHLQGLANAGLTHLHLLPVFDFATVDDDPQARQEPAIPAAPPNSSAQAEAVAVAQEVDGFNWGYDPYHYAVPEGSYATDANGTARILEFRQMVLALHEVGLRVVMDVVYNHTLDGGQAPRSVLDKIVPGYYHRLNAEGGIETSTCCANTATEHRMMEKLMLDSLRIWVEHYGVDGFRFDLMGHHMKENMLHVQAMLAAIDPSLYIYGEGWDFGEVAHNARGINATQFNLNGTGIGNFNDRFRNAVRGGRPFDSGSELIANQGFVNGLWYAPNAENWGHDWERDALLTLSDQIRVGLAGNLADFTFEAANGELTRGWDIDYYGGATGYNLDPRENVIYIEAHDNQTFYDNNVYKLPLDTPMAERVRVQNLGLALTLLAQGVPFLHAGIELLRSKSLERDSYNSGDWFNRIFWDYSFNNFGVGLPLEVGDDAELMKPLLANPALRADQQAIGRCVSYLRALLTIRKSSPLFRLRTAADVIARVAFHNTGPEQIPGLIAMSIASEIDGLPCLDPKHKLIVVIFNATTHTQRFHKPDWQQLGLTLHPALCHAGDEIVLNATVDDDHGVVTVPARTTAVFTAKSG